MPSAHAARERLVQRVKGEYLEMPGLALTLQQAQRLWALDRQTCETVLCLLVQAGFLITTHAGAFVQASSEIPHHSAMSLSAF
jgi:hypothetical protein